jgi:two-component system cell cycle sensor histidine kinase/response regulator CckA
MLRPLIGESVELRLDLAPALPCVRTDRGQLEQAIVNLVVNGRDAMPEGGHLSLSTRAVAFRDGKGSAGRPLDLGPGDYVVITVEDDGKGMDPDIVEHVMEPFYTTKPEGEGTGLGLPMVHGLAKQCGGALALDSDLGAGTRAHIYLPAVDEETTSSQVAGPRSAPEARAKAHTILLVEDEATVRRLAARSLRSDGYEVIEVQNGEQALERALELGDEIDLLLSDVVMPRLSGIELVRRLRSQRADMPVVLMSGYPNPGEGTAIPDDVCFLMKPFEPSDLRDAVDRALLAKRETLPPAR